MPPREKDFSPNADISARNTKQEILEAYEATLRYLEEKQHALPVEEQKKTQERGIVEKASQHSAESVMKEVGTLKFSVVKTLDSLGENLMGECNRLKDIQQAIQLEQQHIQDLYGIKETAHTLSALIRAQDDRKREFETAMQERKATVEKEIEETRSTARQKQDALEAEYKQRKEALEKERKREEEEYNYLTTTTRRKEKDAYDAKKAALEKELNDTIATKEVEFSQREARILAQEHELAELRTEVAAFPARLAQVKAQAVADVTRELETNYRFSSEIRAKETEGELRLHSQTIASLEAKIRDQEAFIAQLTQRSDEARSQVQEIARRALETSSQRYFIPSGEKNTAQAG